MSTASVSVGECEGRVPDSGRAGSKTDTGPPEGGPYSVIFVISVANLSVVSVARR